MAVAIVLDPSEVAGTRTQVTISNWASNEVDWGDAAIEAYMSDAARGNVPVDYRVPNRMISIPLRLRTVGATTFDTIRSQIQAKVGLFQREGGWLKRTSTLGDVFADVVNATLHLGGSGFLETRLMDIEAVLTLECLPDWYQAEVDLGTTTETTAAELRKMMATVKGNYPCRVRIIVNENDADSQLGLIWGLRSKNYSAASTAALAYEAEALTPLDTAAITALAGASGAGSNTMRHNNLATSWTPVLSTQILSGSAHMTHQGSYRVWARVYTTSATPPRLRFLWDVGDLVFPVENSAVMIPAANNFYAVDLGAVRLDPTTGTHRWQGAIQARGAAGGENVYVDRVWFVPTDDGYGVLRAPLNLEPGLVAYSARDEFNQTAGALTGKTAPVGGNWAGAGDADDFAIDAGTHTAQRTAVSDGSGSWVTGPRLVRLPISAALIAVQLNVKTSALPSSLNSRLGLLARYVDASNYIFAGLAILSDGSLVWEAQKVIAGSATAIGQFSPGVVALDAEYTIRFAADAAGRWFLWAWGGGTPISTVPVATGFDSVLATAGTLATGAVGMLDWNPAASAATRTFDGFSAWPPALDAVLFASQSAELRTQGMFREDSTGTAYGPVSYITGDLPRLPPSGLEARSVELFLKASRGDLDQLADSGIDDISTQVYYRPSWLHIPES